MAQSFFSSKWQKLERYGGASRRRGVLTKAPPWTKRYFVPGAGDDGPPSPNIEANFSLTAAFVGPSRPRGSNGRE